MSPAARRRPLLLGILLGLAAAGCSGDRVAPAVRLTAVLDRANVVPSSAQPRAGPVALRAVLRDGIEVEPGVSLAFEWPEFRWDRLLVSLGARRDDPATAPGVVTFIVRTRPVKGQSQRLLEQQLAFSVGARQTDWVDHVIDLSPLREARDAALVLEVESEVPGVTGVWGSPILAAGGNVDPRPDVILISIDTLGIDHMSVYGYERETTPALARFAEDAVVFEQALTHQSWTLTAHASLMTAQYPDTHRVTLGSAFAPDAPVLPGLLRAVGYHTVGWVNNPYLSDAYGYGRFFDRYDFDHETRDERGRVKRSVETTLELVRAWLDDAPPSPSFLFFHVIDTHSDWNQLPYDAPDPFRSRFVSEGVDGASTSWRDYAATDLLAAVNRGQTSLSPEQIDYFRALYDGSIAYTDHHVGRLFELLRERGRYDDALIIVTSDHGEEFLQHGKTMHTQGYEEVLRVPLIVKLPGQRWAGRRVSAQVQLVDVVPTVLDVLGLEPSPKAEGMSLVPVIEGAAHPRPLAIAKGRNHSLTPRDVYVARNERWKLIWHLEGDRVELYDLVADPGERDDVAGAHPEVRASMRASLIEHRNQRSVGVHVRIPGSREPAVLELRIRSQAPMATVSAVDLNGDPGPTPWLVRSEDGRELRLRIVDTEDRRWRPMGVDFQLAASAPSFEIEASRDGQPLPVERLLLGDQHAVARSNPLSLTSGSGLLAPAADGTVDFPYTTDEPSVYLWESGATANPAAELSGEAKSALEALGYVVD